MKPWEFRELVPEKKAELMAHWQASRETENYEKAEAMRDTGQTGSGQQKTKPRM